MTHAEIEEEVRAACMAQELERAAHLAVDGYGAEVLGYLRAVTADPALADDAFAGCCEDLWRGLPSFRWACSLRTWFYTLARHALSRATRSPMDQAGRLRSLGALSARVEHLRTQTRPWQRTDVKDRFRALRDQLPPDDRSLLVLRVDRGLTWDEVARVFAAPDEALDRVSARLRKRYQTIKGRLRRMAEAEGLVPRR